MASPFSCLLPELYIFVIKHMRLLGGYCVTSSFTWLYSLHGTLVIPLRTACLGREDVRSVFCLDECFVCEYLLMTCRAAKDPGRTIIFQFPVNKMSLQAISGRNPRVYFLLHLSLARETFCCAFKRTFMSQMFNSYCIL